MSAVRSNEQLLFLLKLIEVNLETKRRNVNVRHKIWKGIAQKLNLLSANGAEKDADGWKRCYKTWRLSVGPNYRMKMEELLKSGEVSFKILPSDGNYLVNVSDDEAEVDDTTVANITEVDPIEKQKQLLHELVMKHKVLLLSTADDEPLKVRLWENIAEQLNKIPGALTLTPMQWKESVDLDKYRTKRGRKPKRSKTTSESHGTNSSYVSNDETTEASTSSQSLKSKNALQGSNISATLEAINGIDKKLEDIIDDGNLTESDFMPSEDDETLLTEPEIKRPRPSPLVKNFKFSNHMVNAVEQLRDDVQCVNNTLKETTDSLISIGKILERQCEQQDEFNALLKRNTQLLKVLVEFKIGKRTSITKRNYQITHEEG